MLSLDFNNRKYQSCESIWLIFSLFSINEKIAGQLNSGVLDTESLRVSLKHDTYSGLNNATIFVNIVAEGLVRQAADQSKAGVLLLCPSRLPSMV